MIIVTDKKVTEISFGKQSKPLLFQVWIDLNCGGIGGPPDWWWNSPPKPLAAALDEAAKARKTNWICKVIPEGINPRPDGRWDNPCSPL